MAKRCFMVLLAGSLAAIGNAADVGTNLTITRFDAAGNLAWTNALVPGVNTIQTAPTPAGPWTSQQNYFTTTAVSQAQAPLSSDPLFVRLLAVDVSGTPEGHANLTQAYGLLETIAGTGLTPADKTDNWRPEFEGGPATDAALSRPHIAFADADNNVLLVDEGSSLVLEITTNGLIYPWAGVPNQRGFNGEGPAPALSVQLNFPNGGYMTPNGNFYIMDTYNSRVRRVTNGIMSTVFIQPEQNQFDREGRGLWVRHDESEIYFCAGTTLSRWTPAGGVELIRGGFLDLGNITGDDETGMLYITDRDRHSVYTYMPGGDLVRIAGNGTQSGGGDGFPALQTGLSRPRAIALLPNGGYLLGEHWDSNPPLGCRLWYVDPAGIIHLWINGSVDRYAGDGDWFYSNPTSLKLGKVRAVTLDRRGNVIMVVNDRGYVRRIRFQRINAQ